MKKLLILAAAVAMGVMNAQAVPLLYAQVEIKFDTEAEPNFTNYKSVYILSSAVYDEWKLDGTKENLVKSVYLGYSDGGYQDGDVMKYWSNKDKGILIGEGAGKSYSKYYAVATDGNKYVAQVGTRKGGSSSEYYTIEFKGTEGAVPTPFAGATPAPEPTSGLLLLLGVAGLALRRKRA